MNNIEITIDRLVPGGQGIGTIPELSQKSLATLSDREKAILTPGKKGFFWNVLPGEIVSEFTITKNKSHYFEAIATNIKNPSAHRIKPKDSCFLATSPWQIMDYAYELTQKSELLHEVFRQNNLDFTDIAPVQTDGNDFLYRNKMEYSLYWDIGESKIKLAQHARGSHRKIPLETSSIERPEIFKEAARIISELNANGEEARKYQSLLLRASQDGKISGGLYENKKPHPTFKNLTDTILGYTYSYSPNGFFQINLPVYEMALKEIRSHIETDQVLDLYSGVGTIGLSVARDRQLTLVECNKFAYQELEKNCKNVDGRHVVPVLSESENALSYISPDQTVILDPPRAGCDKKLLDKLLEIGPLSIIYLSCNPATQARDIKILTNGHIQSQETSDDIKPHNHKSYRYQIAKVVPYNFFPRTPHLENLVILQKLI